MLKWISESRADHPVEPTDDPLATVLKTKQIYAVSRVNPIYEEDENIQISTCVDYQRSSGYSSKYPASDNCDEETTSKDPSSKKKISFTSSNKKKNISAPVLMHTKELQWQRSMKYNTSKSDNSSEKKYMCKYCYELNSFDENMQINQLKNKNNDRNITRSKVCVLDQYSHSTQNNNSLKNNENKIFELPRQDWISVNDQNIWKSSSVKTIQKVLECSTLEVSNLNKSNSYSSIGAYITDSSHSYEELDSKQMKKQKEKKTHRYTNGIEFTLDGIQTERLFKKMEARKNRYMWCKIVIIFLAFFVFILTVVLVSMLLTRGKRLFGSL